MKEQDLEPIEINGKKYFTVWQFSKKTKKSETAIFNLISGGNKIRQLKCDRFFGKPIIPVEELTEFPFTLPGGGRTVYHYNEDGTQTEMIPMEQSSEY